MNYLIKSFIAILSAKFCLSVCQAQASSLADFSVKASFIDAMSHALSHRVYGLDFHSYQRVRLKIADGDVFGAGIHAAYARVAHCDRAQQINDWSQLTCRWDDVIYAKECVGKPCFVVRLAPFIVSDKELYRVVEAAVRDPCRFIPEAESINKKFNLRKVHSPGVLHISEISRYHLRCGLSAQVSGVMERRSGYGDDAYIIKFGIESD